MLFSHWTKNIWTTNKTSETIYKLNSFQQENVNVDINELGHSCIVHVFKHDIHIQMYKGIIKESKHLCTWTWLLLSEVRLLNHIHRHQCKGGLPDYKGTRGTHTHTHITIKLWQTVLHACMHDVYLFDCLLLPAFWNHFLCLSSFQYPRNTFCFTIPFSYYHWRKNYQIIDTQAHYYFSIQCLLDLQFLLSYMQYWTGIFINFQQVIVIHVTFMRV